MLRNALIAALLAATVGVAASASSFEFYRSGDVVSAVFTNRTGHRVDGLLLRVCEPIEKIYEIGVGADLAAVQQSTTEIVYEGFVLPHGSWEIGWTWDGLRLESAAWLLGNAVIEEIDVHVPTARMFIQQDCERNVIQFAALGSADPDGLPLLVCIWAFDDGCVLEGYRVERSFAENTSGRVALTVVDAELKYTVRGASFGFMLEPHCQAPPRLFAPPPGGSPVDKVHQKLQELDDLIDALSKGSGQYGPGCEECATNHLDLMRLALQQEKFEIIKGMTEALLDQIKNATEAIVRNL